MYWVILLLLAQTQTGAPTQIDRGEALFFQAPDGCGTCHSLKSKGTAIGPDLKGIARLSPAGISMAIRSTVTQYVQVMKVKAGDSFPAMPPAKDQQTVKLYDLSKMPPELHEVDKADFSMSANQVWKHPPSAKKYTDQQLADIIAYVRYAGAGTRAPVDPDDVK